MKLENIILVYTIMSVIVLGNQGCSNDTLNAEVPEKIIPGGDEENTENVEIPEASINIVSKSWGDGIFLIKENQPDGLILVEEDSEFLNYTNKTKSFEISYDFVENQLRSALLLFPNNSSKESSRYKLESYKYLGNIDGASVYISPDNITMGTIINQNVDGKNYIAIGFTPLESDLFLTINPIEVSTLAAKNITKNSMTLCGSYTGETDNPKATIRYSFEKDMANYKELSCNITNRKFENTLSNIATNTTVYYQARIVDEGIVYEGKVESADVEYQLTYAIGDPYPDAKSPQGIVCSITNGGANGTIVSLDQGYLEWDEESLFNKNYYCNSIYDGSLNDMGNINPFAKWVRAHGTGWYGPALEQLFFTKENLKKINQGLRSVGGKELNGFYWSSSEYKVSYAWVTTITETSYAGSYTNGYYFYNSKNQGHSVIAMKNF